MCESSNNFQKFSFHDRVHHGRESYQSRENANLLVSDEYVLCVGSSQKKPVLKWDKNIGWPGKLILTDHALYFQV